MKIEIDGEYEGLGENKFKFYLNELERNSVLSNAEAIAYKQLKEELINHGKNALIANIGESEASYIDGGMCICRDGDFWLVFHSERKIRSQLSIFSSPYDAANYFLWISLCSPRNKNISIGCIPKVQ